MICVCYDVDILISGYAVDERAQFIMGGYCALYISMVFFTVILTLVNSSRNLQ